MDESQQQPDLALSAANYSPPQPASGVNSDVAAQIQAAVESALNAERARQAAANAPRVLSPEEAAREHLDTRGVGLGVEERLAALYGVLDLLAKKVGV